MKTVKCPFCGQELKMIGDEYDAKYPSNSYYCECACVPFAFGNKLAWAKIRNLNNENKELRKDLERTRKALGIIKRELHKETMPDFAVIKDALKIA